MLAAGATFFLVAICFSAYEAFFLTHSLRGQGVVIANVKSHVSADPQAGAPEQTNYCPQFRYKSADGITYISTASVCSNPPEFWIGEIVAVTYSKSSQSHAQIDSIGDKWGFSIAFGAIGVVLVPAGVFTLRRLREQGRTLHLLSAFWG